MSDRATLAHAFLAATEWADATRQTVAGDASNRRYERLTHAGQTAILMDAPPERGEDVGPFVRVARYLTAQRISAPEIFHIDAANGFLIIEDLGDALFARLMQDDPDRQVPLYRAATDLLIHLHRAAPLDLPACDTQWLVDMMDPVFEYYAPDHTPESKRQLQDSFRRLAAPVEDIKKVTILRDFHAENLLWLPARAGVAQVGVLDFQDALLGHPAYDLVSILQDARRDVSVQVEAQIIDHYLNQTQIAPDRFRTAYALLGVQRNLRILGIFARLCLRDGKAHYVDMIPRVWGYVMRNLNDPTLAPLAEQITTLLPSPDPSFLEQLKSQCTTAP